MPYIESGKLRVAGRQGVWRTHADQLSMNRRGNALGPRDGYLRTCSGMRPVPAASRNCSNKAAAKPDRRYSERTGFPFHAMRGGMEHL